MNVFTFIIASAAILRSRAQEDESEHEITNIHPDLLIPPPEPTGPAVVDLITVFDVDTKDVVAMNHRTREVVSKLFEDQPIQNTQIQATNPTNWEGKGCRDILPLRKMWSTKISIPEVRPPLPPAPPPGPASAGRRSARRATRSRPATGCSRRAAPVCS